MEGTSASLAMLLFIFGVLIPLMGGSCRRTDLHRLSVDFAVAVGVSACAGCRVLYTNGGLGFLSDFAVAFDMHFNTSAYHLGTKLRELPIG